MMRSLLLLTLFSQDVKVTEKKDIGYVAGEGAGARKQTLDLYLPRTDKPFPVLMWIYGGAWRIGDKAMYAELGRRFAEAGIGCAVINYRLTPEVRYPDHVKDCALAFAWVHAHIEAHGGNPDRLFVSGQSAGGHLTALLAMDRRYLAELKVPEGAIKGAIPMSGVYRIPAVQADLPMLGMFKQAFGTDARVCAEASPITYASEAKTPMLVITEDDARGMIRPSMQAFERALAQAGFKGAEFVDAKDRTHITIVTKLQRTGDDPVRTAMIEFIRKRCAELETEAAASRPLAPTAQRDGSRSRPAAR